MSVNSSEGLAHALLIDTNTAWSKNKFLQASKDVTFLDSGYMFPYIATFPVKYALSSIIR